MIRLLVLCCALALSSLSHADEDGSEDVANLTYYPHAGHFYVTGQYTTMIDDHFNSSIGSSSRTDLHRLQLAGVYGFGDKMRVGIREGYLIESKTKQSSALGNISNYRSSGISDPTAFFNWRYYGHTESGWDADLNFSISPKLGTDEHATVNEDGNNLNGYSQINVGTTAFYRSSSSNEMSGHFDLEYRTQQDSDLGAATTRTTDVATIVSLRFADRFRFHPKFFVQGALQLNLPHTLTSADSTGASNSDEVATLIIPSVSVGWKTSDNSLLTLNSNYEHSSNKLVTQPAGSETHTDDVQIPIQLSYLQQF